MNFLRHAVLGLTCGLLPMLVHADEWAPNLTAAAAWNSNVSHADLSDDQIDSLQIKADILASERYPMGLMDTLYLRGHFAGEWWPRYRGLLSGAAGGRAEWQHAFGGSPRAPVIALEGAADAWWAREKGRDGVNLGVTASVRQRVNNFARATLWHELSWFDARYGVFDSAASETGLELDGDLNAKTRLTFTARYRDGDVLSYASGLRPDLEALAPQRRAVSTFGRDMTAYRIDARTLSGRLAFVRALDESSAIVVAYERRETQRSSLRFREHVLSIGMVYQF